MRALRTLPVVLIATLLVSAGCATGAASMQPKLVVAIIIDQFRYDYLTRFRHDYHGGLDRMLVRGADFTNAFYGQVPTVTAVGHSLFLSGAMPAMSGIVSNAWYDRDEEQVVTSVCDWTETIVGGDQVKKGAQCTDSDPASPRRLLVTTVGDELRGADGESKVIGVSIKARGAILPSGHRAAGAYWFDDRSGNFVTSTFYMQKLPPWAAAFNGEKIAAKDVNRKWDNFPQWDFRAERGHPAYSKIPASPWGNELIEEFAERLLTGEKLGQRGHTDLLTVSFSSNDYVGHQVGPDAPEVRDMALRADQLLAKLFRAIDAHVGLENALVVLSADHGVATAPSEGEKQHLPGGYVAADLEDAVQNALSKRFGKEEWLVPGAGESSLYLRHEAMEKAKTADGRTASAGEVYAVAREALLALPQLHVSRVYSREQLDNGIAGDFIAQAAINGYFPRRSADLTVIFDAGFVPGTHGTSHSSPWAYDRHVPVLFMGPGVKAGRYDATIQPNDIAPTLATMLDIQTPSGSSGRVLTEMLAR